MERYIENFTTLCAPKKYYWYNISCALIIPGPRSGNGSPWLPFWYLVGFRAIIMKIYWNIKICCVLQTQTLICWATDTLLNQNSLRGIGFVRHFRIWKIKLYCRRFSGEWNWYNSNVWACSGSRGKHISERVQDEEKDSDRGESVRQCVCVLLLLLMCVLYVCVYVHVPSVSMYETHTTQSAQTYVLFQE